MRTRAHHALLLLIWGCTGGEQAEVADRAPDAALPDDRLPDADADGLCDFTEDELGTDPLAADTDRDGLPDLVELLHSFVPTDWSSPASTQLAHLEARQAATAQFAVRVTVEGDGQGVSGDFDALPSSYDDELSAADFFAGASAVSASPMDAVRSIDEGSARFAAVLGRTRLAFDLRFDYPWDELGELPCARSYPFRYAIKSDDGETRSNGLYLLVVSPEGTVGTEARHCLPLHCE